VRIVLTSGRSPSGLRPIVRELGIVGYSVAFSGALRCRTFPDRPADSVSGERMDLLDAREVAVRGRELGVSVAWWDTEEWYVDAEYPPVVHEAGVIGLRPLVRDLSRLEIAPFKLQCMVGMEDIDRLQALRGSCPRTLGVSFSNSNYLEVVRAGTDKARSLARLGEQMGVSLSEMAAIGDGENDLPMLAEVGLGIAMANASPSVRGAAAWVTKSNDDEGVALAIERMRGEGRF